MMKGHAPSKNHIARSSNTFIVQKPDCKKLEHLQWKLPRPPVPADSAWNRTPAKDTWGQRKRGERDAARPEELIWSRNTRLTYVYHVAGSRA